MRIGYAGPISFDLLRPYLHADQREVYSGRLYPQGSLLIGTLLDAGHTVTVYTLDHEQAAPRALEAEGPRLRVRILPYRKRLRWLDSFRVEVEQLRSAMIQDDYDVLHAQWSYEYGLAAIATGRPHVVTVRDWAALVVRMQRSPRTMLYRAVRWRMSRSVLRRAQTLTVTSPYMADLVREHYGREPTLVPNALSRHVFQAGERAADDPPSLVSINNGFDHRKNVHTLLEAFPLVLRDVPSARLRLIGNAYGAGEAAARWAESRGLARNVDFLGRVDFDAVLDELRGAAALVHPSREESFGGTLLEAMACGTPVIAGATSGAVPWVLDEGRSGVLTNVDDPVELASSVLGVLRDPDLASSLSQEGRRRAGEFDLDRIVERYVTVYEQAAAEQPKE